MLGRSSLVAVGFTHLVGFTHSLTAWSHAHTSSADRRGHAHTLFLALSCACALVGHLTALALVLPLASLAHSLARWPRSRVPSRVAAAFHAHVSHARTNPQADVALVCTRHTRALTLAFASDRGPHSCAGHGLDPPLVYTGHAFARRLCAPLFGSGFVGFVHRLGAGGIQPPHR